VKLRSYLIALVLTTMVPLVVVTAASAWWAAAGERAKEETEMRRLAIAGSGAVEVAIGQRLVLAQAMASTPVLPEQGGRAAFEALARRAAAATGIDILAGGHDGVQFMNTWVPPGEPIDARPRPDLAKRAIESGRPYLMDVQPGPRTGEPISAILVPARGLAGEDIVVAVRVEPERLATLLPNPARWRDGFAALFDGAGKPVALAAGTPEYTWRLRVEHGPDREPHLARSTEARLHAVLAPVGGTGWHVAVGAPEAAIAEALRREVWQLAAVGAAGVLLAVAAAALLGRFLLREARPLMAATEGVAEEAPELPRSRVREVEVLRRALIGAGSAVRDRATAVARLRLVAEDAALLEKRVAERTRQLEETTGQLLNAQDEERRRIARELHDSTVQELIAASLSLAQAEAALDLQERHQARASLAEACASLGRAKEELRTVSFVLQPPLLDECGLATALQVYVEGFSKRTGIAVEVTVPNTQIEIRRAVETALFRVLQEALANVHRHSGACGATVQLSASAEKLVLQIADDGRGISVPSRDGGKAEGVGIPGMRARMRQLGGDLEIHSTSFGTLISAYVPMSPPGAESWRAQVGRHAGQ
jgi:signal transduction histidine kinase